MTTFKMSRAGRLLMPLTVAAAMLVAAAPALGQELGDRCTNPESRYTVDFPSGWYVNGHVEGGETDDVAACRFFSPDDFEVLPASQTSGIAVAVSVQHDGPQEPGEPTTVGGRSAIMVDSVSETDGIDPAGTRYHSYWIELTNGTWLLASTSDGPTWVGDFDENSSVLDAMMDSLTFGSGTMPDTAIGAGPSVAAGTLVGGAALLMGAMALAAIWLRTARAAA